MFANLPHTDLPVVASNILIGIQTNDAIVLVSARTSFKYTTDSQPFVALTNKSCVIGADSNITDGLIKAFSRANPAAPSDLASLLVKHHPEPCQAMVVMTDKVGKTSLSKIFSGSTMPESANILTIGIDDKIFDRVLTDNADNALKTCFSLLGSNKQVYRDIYMVYAASIVQLQERQLTVQNLHHSEIEGLLWKPFPGSFAANRFVLAFNRVGREQMPCLDVEEFNSNDPNSKVKLDAYLNAEKQRVARAERYAKSSFGVKSTLNPSDMSGFSSVSTVHSGNLSIDAYTNPKRGSHERKPSTPGHNINAPSSQPWLRRLHNHPESKYVVDKPMPSTSRTPARGNKPSVNRAAGPVAFDSFDFPPLASSSKDAKPKGMRKLQ